MIPFIAISTFLCLIFLQANIVANRKRKSKLAAINNLQHDYFNSLKSKKPVFETFKKGILYYKALEQGNTSFEKVKQDFIDKYGFNEFDAILVCFFNCAYNPTKDKLIDDKRIKIAEILLSWKIDFEEIESTKVNCLNYVKMVEGKIDYKKIFSLIDPEKHTHIILLMCDILFTGKHLSTTQENIINNLKTINTEANKLILNSIDYYTNRNKAMGYEWDFLNNDITFKGT